MQLVLQFIFYAARFPSQFSLHTQWRQYWLQKKKINCKTPLTIILRACIEKFQGNFIYHVNSFDDTNHHVVSIQAIRSVFCLDFSVQDKSPCFVWSCRHQGQILELMFTSSSFRHTACTLIPYLAPHWLIPSTRLRGYGHCAEELPDHAALEMFHLLRSRFLGVKLCTGVRAYAWIWSCAQHSIWLQSDRTV